MVHAAGAWEGISVPEGWEPLARACASLTERLESFIPRVAETIFAEVEEYRTSSVTVEQIAVVADLLIRPALLGWAQNIGPTPEQIMLGWEIGRLRAQEGGGPETVGRIVRAFQVAFRETWLELQSTIEPEGREPLYRSVTTLWQWLQAMGDAVLRGYQEASRASEVVRADTVASFIEALRRGDVGGIEDLARSLGFDPAGTFRAVCVRTAIDPFAVRSAFARMGGHAEVLARGLDLTVMTQGLEPRALDEAIVNGTDGAPVGVGLERMRLEGAQRSLVDAGRALDMSQASGRAVYFERDWLHVTLYSQREHLAPILADAIRVTNEQPHIADGVRTFGLSGFSQTEASRRLHLQPHSLAYRLRRWRQLTGSEPLSVDAITTAFLAQLAIAADGDRRDG